VQAEFMLKTLVVTSVAQKPVARVEESIQRYDGRDAYDSLRIVFGICQSNIIPGKLESIA